MSTNPTSAQSRRPAGTPTGGQFAPETHAEPEVTLGAQPPGLESTPTADAVGIVRWRNADGGTPMAGSTGPMARPSSGLTADRSGG